MFIIEMPINKDGDGPEMDENLVVKTLYEIWDYDFMTVCSFNTKEEAEKRLTELMVEEVFEQNKDMGYY